MVVGGAWQRNKDRSLACRRDLRQRRRTGATHDQIRLSDPPSHVEQKRFDLGLQPRPAVGGADHLRVALAGLVRETKMRTARRQLRGGLHHRRVDGVRALGPAKHQNLRD